MALDIRDLAKAKTDQLNADDLKGRNLIATITAARAGDAEQKLVLHLDSWEQPWKPCKTMMRLLGDVWNEHDAERWVGRTVELYRDPSVTFGRDKVGGIRVSAVSHITRRTTVMLPVSRGRRDKFNVEPLKIDAPPTLADIGKAAGFTLEDLNRWHLAKWNNPAPADGTTTAAELATFLSKNASLVAEIKRSSDSPLGSETKTGGEE